MLLIDRDAMGGTWSPGRVVAVECREARRQDGPCRIDVPKEKRIPGIGRCDGLSDDGYWICSRRKHRLRAGGRSLDIERVRIVARRGKATTVVTLAPAALTFAATVVGSSAAPQALTLKNTGTATLAIGSIAVWGPNASSFTIGSNTCGATLAAAASCSSPRPLRPPWPVH